MAAMTFWPRSCRTPADIYPQAGRGHWEGGTRREQARLCLPHHNPFLPPRPSQPQTPTMAASPELRTLSQACPPPRAPACRNC